jgi:hypothetical protein
MFDRARCLDPSPLTASPFVSMDALRSSAAGIEAAAVILECAAFWRIQILSRAESGSAVRLKRAVSFTSPCYDRRCYNSRIASPPQKLHRSPFPGNGISRPETKAPKRPPRFNCPFAETEWSPRTPPIGGYSPVAGRSPFAMVWGCCPRTARSARPVLGYIGSNSRRSLNQSTLTSVAYSTASSDRHGPRRWMTSVLNRPITVRGAVAFLLFLLPKPPPLVRRWRRTGWLGRQESNYRISNDAVRPLNSLRRPTDGPNPPFR